MTNLDSILKSRDITLPTKVRLDKAMVFPVVMYGCETDSRAGLGSGLLREARREQVAGLGEYRLYKNLNGKL